MLVQAEKIKNLLSINLDLDKFYAIRIYENTIQLQGEAKKLTITECEAAGFVFTYEYHYLEAKKDGVEITLSFIL
jgi:hypothetical protein